ncbi:hypothetical protein G6F46_007814 [Rhizopus delemar]|uniref:F-box domain-containing protein n=2 Tax=Rhizopus TaxID=4842 RepID=A0A9P7CNC0_9FUNG|nr:hypothetical protein G6F55_007126 [Rhizopus delemar]KAG1541166.1 hypothetical protein G6F51_008062 [Rhizopus arrhizus]KAG1495293.1 hypothetical protein G6F54_007272 [Rhizopus delemar]KAG1509260.1 hypothetical protein G6F53_007586 [Rhizopus delemar]KAG1521449.1 hypothetical protein G6F52_006735 [Rhizopus delemar]
MNILDLPAELLLRIVYHINSIQEKCQLRQTCTQLNTLLSSHPTCWSHLDLSPFYNINNTALLTFLKNCGIALASSDDPVPNTVTTLDISGCKHLSENMLVALCKTFTGLTELGISGFQLSKEPEYIKGRQSKVFEQLRDHVYQVQPSHGLSSMTMDLSKKSTQQLIIPFVLLSSMLKELPNLKSISMQYQELIPLPSLMAQRPFSCLANVEHIDISSCRVTQPALQMLLRNIGPHLITLKMLNIHVSHLTALCLQHHCKQLECLHLSCNDQGLLHAINHALSNLKKLKDFRMTRTWFGSVDSVVDQLNIDILEKLDLSPKMNIYAKTVPTTKTPAAQIKLAQHMNNNTITSSNKHPIKTSVLPAAIDYATIEHYLHFTDQSLHRLSQCRHLTELRLCFPMISAKALLHFCQAETASSCLQVFELRLKSEQGDEENPGYSLGIPYLVNLRELFLYSVDLPTNTILSITSNLKKLKYLTISDGGEPIKKHYLQTALLRDLPLLRILRLGKLNKPLSWPETLVELDHSQQQQSNIIFTKSYHQNKWHVQ